jgi:hypothetical protein
VFEKIFGFEILDMRYGIGDMGFGKILSLTSRPSNPESNLTKKSPSKKLRGIIFFARN